MAVPAHDQRDYEFATQFKLPIKTVVMPDAGQKPPENVAFVDYGYAVNSPIINSLPTEQAKAKMIDYLEEQALGRRAVTYKLRDWLFSRQRYWGEPFPILLDGQDNPIAIPENELPVVLPELSDFKPTGTPEPPLSKAQDWLKVKANCQILARETNTMPQWAGSCWYYLRYIDPNNENRFVDPEKEKYWMPVDLYVGGVEHAVLHLLYARFWHKVLFDLGHVSTPEPFQRLYNQGMVQAYAYVDSRGVYVEASEVVEQDGGYYFHGEPVTREYGKMGKSLKNVVTPDDIYRDYGADTLRLYEMFMGPLEKERPWNTADIVGVNRF